MSRQSIAGVVLAAGPSRRFGVQPPKQLARFHGQPLVRRAVSVALASLLSEIIVVVGLAAAEVSAVLEGFDVRLIHNPRYSQGQSTSVKAGLTAVGDRVAAAMFLPVDQPHLSAPVIDALVDCYRRTSASIVVPTFAGRRGAPVIIDRSLFGELATIDGDVGGRQLFAAHREDLVELALGSGEPLQDIDTPSDLAELES